MDSDEDYYRYVSLYYPDGEFASKRAGKSG